MDTVNLSTLFTTKSQAIDFSNLLDQILAEIYTADFNLEKVFMQKFGINKTNKLMSLFRNNQINSNDLKQVKQFLESVKAKISTLPTITLVIAFEPNEEILQSISNWFFINTNKQLLLNIIVDPKLVAGATVSFQGKYFDGSLQKLVDELITGYQMPRGIQPSNNQPIAHNNLDHKLVNQ